MPRIACWYDSPHARGRAAKVAVLQAQLLEHDLAVLGHGCCVKEEEEDGRVESAAMEGGGGCPRSIPPIASGPLAESSERTGEPMVLSEIEGDRSRLWLGGLRGGGCGKSKESDANTPGRRGGRGSSFVRLVCLFVRVRARRIKSMAFCVFCVSV